MAPIMAAHPFLGGWCAADAPDPPANGGVVGGDLARAGPAWQGGPVIELVRTDGIFALDGGEWAVTNNIWLIGDDREVLVIDAAHDHRPIVDAVHGRRVVAIALTHGHNDHINAAIPLRDAVDAPIWLHDADHMLWEVVWPGATGRSFSDFPTIIDSIRSKLLTLPPETIVHTGHGESTTIGAEAADVDDWLRRGH
jgi:glyoxylase-like metal-dependent hydrolase (beta-lactamase superfamily II)